MDPQVDLEVVRGSEGLPAVGAVLHGGAQGPVSVLGGGWLDPGSRLSRFVPGICNNTAHTRSEWPPRTSRAEEAFLFFPSIFFPPSKNC